MAYYLSGVDEAPGKILIENPTLGADAFTVFADRAGSFSPVLTTSSTGAQASKNDRRPHGVSYSVTDEPEGVPLNNWFPVAPKDVELLRGVPFRDKLYIFTAGRKIYTVTGPAPYRVDEIEGSAQLISADTVKVHANQVFALTDQGVGILTDAGFRIISAPIEDQLLDVLSLDPATVARYSFSVSYEADRQYQVWVPTSDNATCASRGYVYNSLYDSWTMWEGERTWGAVSPVDGKLYMGDGATPKVREERKTLDRTDFVDDAFQVEIDSIDAAKVLTLVDASDVEAGDLLNQAGTISLITEVDGNTITLATEETWIEDVCDVYRAIDVVLKWTPVAPAGPCAMKTFQDCTFHFREYVGYSPQATFDSETYNTEEAATFKPFVGYGLGGYGEGPFGSPSGLRNRRVEVTTNHRSAAMIRVGLHVREAYALWGCEGFTLNYEVAGPGGRP